MSNLTSGYYASKIDVKCMTVCWQIYVQLSLSRRHGISLPKASLRGEAFSEQTQ